MKIFCIGRNKTGTTSLEKVFKDFGYVIGDQTKGELLIDHYKNGRFRSIINFCKTAEVFQDAPFSWPFTWLILHEHFPDAKFVLSYRNEEDWYNSITSFHSKLFSKNDDLPTKSDLENSTYRYKGFLWDANRAVWKTPEDDIYNKQLLIDNYNRHNNDILHYFKDKSNFIAIDVSDENDYIKLCEFLHKKPLYQRFPHINKS